MNIYNIAICEDNKEQLKELEELFLKYEKNEKVKFNISKFNSGELLIENGYENYKIIVLDIKMGKLNGIEIAKIIRKNNEDIKIIFVTALEEYWPEGYTVNAFRYIIKPIDKTQFYNEIHTLIDEIKKNNLYITLNCNGEIIVTQIKDIKYFEIVDRKVKVTTTMGVYISNYNLSYWNDRLHIYGFANPHSSYLVNMKYVTSISKDKVTLLNDISIHVSQRKYKEFKDRFTKYLGEI